MAPSFSPVPSDEESPSGGLTRRNFLLASGLSGLLAAVAACTSGNANDVGTSPSADSSGSSPAGAAKKGGTLRVGLPTPPTAVDPVSMYDGSAIIVVQLVADYLIWLDSDFSLQPRLATSWRSEKGGKRWVFQLRKGVQFSDGSALTSADVKASFDRLLDPKSKSAALSAFDTILAAGGVSAPDSSSVVFDLERAFSDFPYLVSAGNYNAVILKAGYQGGFTKKAIGTGPFLLSSYNASSGAKFTRNPKYWQPDKLFLDGVNIRFYGDEQAQVLGLQGGDVDVLGLTPVAEVRASGSIALDTAPGTGLITFTLRTDQAPFTDKRVRQAIAAGLDRPGINQATRNGIGEVGNDHLYAPVYPAAPKNIPQRAKDRDLVQKLLKAAGHENLSFTLTYDPPSKDYAVVVQDQLKDVGITVKLDERTSQAFYGGDQEKDTPWLFTPANLVGWAGRPVPSQFVAPMVTSKGIWNGSKYANPKLDAALTAYDAATNAAKRAEQADIIAKALHEDVPVIISVWNGAARAYDKSKFRGIKAHPSSYLDVLGVSRA